MVRRLKTAKKAKPAKPAKTDARYWKKAAESAAAIVESIAKGKLRRAQNRPSAPAPAIETESPPQKVVVWNTHEGGYQIELIDREDVSIVSAFCTDARRTFQIADYLASSRGVPAYYLKLSWYADPSTGKLGYLPRTWHPLSIIIREPAPLA